MRVLVTGATGFVGHALVDQLLLDGHDVSALVRTFSTALPKSVEQVVFGDIVALNKIDSSTSLGMPDDELGVARCGLDSRLRGNDNIGSGHGVVHQSTRIVTTSNEVQHLYDALSGTETVIHTAARAHVMKDSTQDPLAAFRKINTEATLSLARQAVKAGVKRFIFISTIGVNGAVTTDKPFSEQDAPAPHNDYALSKWEAEQGMRHIASQSGMEVVIIRPPLIYGSAAPGNFRTLLKWVRKGVPLPLAKINNHRSFIALANVVDFINLVLAHPKAADETFLISDGRDVSTSNLLKVTADALNVPSRLFYVPAGLVHFFARLVKREHMLEQLWGSLEIDISKAKTLLDWQPAVTMDEQLRKMAEQRPLSTTRGDGER